MTIRLGVAGTGGISHLHFQQLSELDTVKVTALCDPNEENRMKVIKRFPELSEAVTFDRYEDMLKAQVVDAVLICSPHTLHFSQAMQALQYDCHVMLEKPMTCSSKEAAALIAEAEQKQKVLQVSYQRHFMPVFQYIKTALSDGTIGALTSVSASLYQGWRDGSAGTWRQNPALSGGGMLMDSGSHLIDALLWTTGMTPESIQGHISKQGAPVEIDTQVSIRFTEGPLANLTVIGHAPTWEERFMFCGEQGAITLNDGKVRLCYPGQEPITPDLPVQTTNADKSFIDAILGKHEVVVPGTFAEKVVRLTEDIYAHTGYEPIKA
ncbi:Gfo/Idh/MocA family oxidoreductase [Bacillaceae bacterium SIJ1]|uniref:Gfo/Idh/MocA family protein n=1 Tax=Litoribacterium kuwaitense TaxID=1398745 RepID=UPI0013EABBD5|nr:Gfo/Idh/MocA family oxidoreductase [Litoribacterium kuwaitense]NGP46144.1 Gfo/Idh/MocA family oxidoreductase [Litoribacterium kuwaitense]